MIVAYFAVLMAGKAFALWRQPSRPRPYTGCSPRFTNTRTSRTTSCPRRKERENRTTPSDRARARWLFRLLISKSKSISGAEPGWRYANAAFRSP